MIQHLLDKLEKCSGAGDREIDAEIARMFDNPPAPANPERAHPEFDWHYRSMGVWMREEFNQPAPPQFWHAKHYTASVDAALALVARVLPTAGWSVSGGTVASSCTLWPWDGRRDEMVVQAETPALAILTATLRALLSQSQENDK